MADPTTNTCPVCGVQIIPGGPAGDQVIFSSGPKGTRSKLWARVCQFNKKPGCINEQGKSANISDDDYYKETPNPSA